MAIGPVNQLTTAFEPVFVGRDASTKQLPNSTPATKFSVVATDSSKDEKSEWKDERQRTLFLRLDKAVPSSCRACDRE
jgi:hypothetical protein